MVADLAKLPQHSCEYPTLSAIRPCSPGIERPQPRTGTDSVRACSPTSDFALYDQLLALSAPAPLQRIGGAPKKIRIGQQNFTLLTGHIPVPGDREKAQEFAEDALQRIVDLRSGPDIRSHTV